MIKQGARWIMKQLTEIYSKQEDGTLHSYDYFEDEDGKWIYNFSFHREGHFAPVQMITEKRIPIAKAIQKARVIYENTRYCHQPSWNN